MLASIVRIALLLTAIFGLYKVYPRFKPVLEPIIKPEVLGAQIIHPAIKTINDFLPDSFQIPTDSSSSPDSPNSSYSSNSSYLPDLINQVKQQAAGVADQQIDNLKTEAGKAFCQVLIERVKTECNINN